MYSTSGRPEVTSPPLCDNVSDTPRGRLHDAYDVVERVANDCDSSSEDEDAVSPPSATDDSDNGDYDTDLEVEGTNNVKIHDSSYLYFSEMLLLIIDAVCQWSIHYKLYKFIIYGL